MCSDIVVQTRKMKSVETNDKNIGFSTKEEIMRILPKYTESNIDN